jgi:hypothetical protein
VLAQKKQYSICIMLIHKPRCDVHAKIDTVKAQRMNCGGDRDGRMRGIHKAAHVYLRASNDYLICDRQTVALPTPCARQAYKNSEVLQH